MENVVSVEDDYLEFPEFALEGGENVMFTILQAPYPDKDPTGRAGKALFDVFEVSAREGEHLSEWSARADSVFHACQRDAGIAFPDMVKGYLCLHRCGLSGDQRAVVLGRTRSTYEIAAIAPALRSCFAEYRVPKLSRRSHGVFVSETAHETEEEEEQDEEDSGDDVDDVEKFLNEDDESDLVLEEDEVREVLASASKQERQEISKEKLRRGFGRPSKSAANPATRKFRTEVEELKLRTMCNRCGNVGHWARECPQKRVQNNKGGGRGGYSARKNEYFPQEN